MAQFVKLLYVPYYVLFCLLIAVANRGVSVEFRFSMDCFTGCIIFVSTAFSLFYRSGADQWGLWSLSVYVMPVLSMADCLWVFRPILRHWGPFETLQWSISVRCWWHATLNHPIYPALNKEHCPPHPSTNKLMPSWVPAKSPGIWIALPFGQAGVLWQEAGCWVSLREQIVLPSFHLRLFQELNGWGAVIKSALQWKWLMALFDELLVALEKEMYSGTLTLPVWNSYASVWVAT